MALVHDCTAKRVSFLGPLGHHKMRSDKLDTLPAGAQWRLPLPMGLNKDGNHVWVPPTFNYSEYTGDTEEKIREAVLKLKGGDRAKMTEIMDKQDEYSLLRTFSEWAAQNRYPAAQLGDNETEAFFWALAADLEYDTRQVNKERRMCSIVLKKDTHDNWTARHLSDYRFLAPPGASTGFNILGEAPLELGPLRGQNSGQQVPMDPYMYEDEASSPSSITPDSQHEDGYDEDPRRWMASSDAPNVRWYSPHGYSPQGSYTREDVQWDLTDPFRGQDEQRDISSDSAEYITADEASSPSLTPVPANEEDSAEEPGRLPPSEPGAASRRIEQGDEYEKEEMEWMASLDADNAEDDLSNCDARETKRRRLV